MARIKRSTGHFLEDFSAGRIFRHKRGKTVTEGLFNDFTDFTFCTSPLYKNVEYARAHGFAQMPCPPGLVMNVTFSQTVEDISENARANLGYIDMKFGVPVFVGDTIEVETKVLEVTPSSKDPDRGVVKVQSTGYNQRREVVLTFQRAVQIWKRDAANAVEKSAIAPEAIAVQSWIPPYDPKVNYKALAHLSSPHGYFEDFTTGDVYEHSRGRVITDEHVPLTAKLDNTSQVHCNQYLIDSNPGKYLGGKLLVYGGLPFNFCLGLSSPDIGENALADLHYRSGNHVSPIFVGDTVFAESEILGTADMPGREDLGLVRSMLRGYKMAQKDGKWEKVQIFELDREIAVKRRSHYA